MRKEEFLAQLRGKLSGLSEENLEDHLAFYSEMINDRMEDGVSEEEAVSAVGTVEEIASQILTEMPAAAKTTKKETGKRSLNAWEIVLLAFGSPVWISLMISLWAVIDSLWIVFAASVWASAGCIYWLIVFLSSGNCDPVMTILGAALLGTGLSIFLFFGCKLATKGTVLLTKKLVLRIKQHFKKKEAV